MSINKHLADLLIPAYNPCPGFTGACSKMRWNPSTGHAPRGFLGGAGKIEEIELVLVFAEPGDPHSGESHTGIDSAYQKSMLAFSEGTDLFHRNVRLILDLCWPGVPFEQQMRKTWMTESVLCSAPKKSGPVSSICERECANRYLVPQIKLLKGCVVAAMGAKARDRMRAVGITSFISAVAAAPPGCNQKHARESWQAIANAIHCRNSA